MTRARPFRDAESMALTADVVWTALYREDWLEAFAAHPRIGEGTSQAWATQEQAGAAGADAAIRKQLSQLNRDYEARFGYIFIICATGKSASEMLGALKQRLGNAPGDELRIAAEEQRK